MTLKCTSCGGPPCPTSRPVEAPSSQSKSRSPRSGSGGPARAPVPAPGTPAPGTPAPGTPSPGTPAPGAPSPVSLRLSPGALNCPVCAGVLPGDGTCSTREPRVSANPGPFPRLSGLSETMATPRRDQRHTEQTSEGTASRSGRFSASGRPGFFGNREAGPRREPGRPGPAVRPLHHAVALALASVRDRDPPCAAGAGDRAAAVTAARHRARAQRRRHRRATPSGLAGPGILGRRCARASLGPRLWDGRLRWPR